jgi:hypothetical protein
MNRKAIIGALALAVSTAACRAKPANHAQDFGPIAPVILAGSCTDIRLHSGNYDWCYDTTNHNWYVWIISSYEEVAEVGPYISEFGPVNE